VEDVELGDGEGVEAVDAGGVAQPHRVDPAAAARPPRDGAELVAAHAQEIGGGSAELGGGRAVTPARAGGLGEGGHARDPGGREGGGGGGGVRGGGGGPPPPLYWTT